MNRSRLKCFGIFLALFCFWTSLALAAGRKPVKAKPKDKCPVCGMFVAKYPDFAAQIQFSDGSTVHFDGTKDMFKYYLELSRYAPGRKAADIAAIFVSNYYDLTMVDGFKAFYVSGSDVYGPMGRELIPFSRESTARDFLNDHKGRSILRFHEITPGVVKSLD
ncbi:MAG: nitrous oxide reductase accessory protein NosL [Geobacteraceae bacterium GWC2_58_44]|nr:MAG: nitrous oxide reductase accessory protein NosL [Geobacteraceae bacterium GWC2_58_44]HBG07524.1 nitrous oxide reductase accessory protein NosL [Geobacter sp.]